MDNFIQIAAFCQPSQLKATTHVLISVDNSKHHSSAICGLSEDGKIHAFHAILMIRIPKVHTPLPHFHISSRNAPDLRPPPPPPRPPKILLNLCFSFLLGITAVPREIENKAYAKFGGANKVYYVENVDMAMKAFTTQRLVIKFPERTP